MRKGQANKSASGKKMPKIESVGYPRPLYGDIEGTLYDIPGYRGLGRFGNQVIPLEGELLIPIPDRSSLYSLPNCRPMLWKKGEIEILPLPLTAVGAVLPEEYIRTAAPAFLEEDLQDNSMPNLAYSAISCWQNKNWVAAVKMKKSFLPEQASKVDLASPRKEIQEICDLPEFVKPSQEWSLVIHYFPGITDNESEIEEWKNFFAENLAPKSIHFVNLDCDWKKLLSYWGKQENLDSGIGLQEFISFLGKLSPDSQIEQILPYWKEERKR